MAKTSLAPGESTTLSVGYDSTKGREIVHQVIRIETNDPINPGDLVRSPRQVQAAVRHRGRRPETRRAEHARRAAQQGWT